MHPGRNSKTGVYKNQMVVETGENNLIIDQHTGEKTTFGELLERKDLHISRLEQQVYELRRVLTKRKEGETQTIMIGISLIGNQ